MAGWKGFRGGGDELDSDDREFMEEYARRMYKNAPTLVEFTDEQELIDVTMERSCLVHIYHPEFQKCHIMDEGLRKIAPAFPDIVFARINVKNCPKMSQSLAVKVLPYVGFFKDGYFVNELVGFEKLGNRPVFELETLQAYIQKSYSLEVPHNAMGPSEIS